MPRILFVTGRLAAPSLGDCLKDIKALEYEIAVLPISVAALMHTSFIAKHLNANTGCSTIMIPGFCEGALDPVAERTGVEVIRGPKDLKDIPLSFGCSRSLNGYGEHRVQILAEIVDAYKMSFEDILARARYFRSNGADIIDLGGPAEGGFPEVGKVVRDLKESGFQVSIDSTDPDDIVKADDAGVDFVLSVNSRNIDAARRLRSKVVAIPDSEEEPDSLERTVSRLETWGVSCIIDPILNPIGFGFSDSIERFIHIRRKFPNATMLMGIGNVTELTDADTTGMNALLAGVVTELGIDYVLTTEVISWALGAVREFDLARRLMYYAWKNRVLPKRLNDALLTIKDPPFQTFTERELRSMQEKVSDRHFRIFTDHEFIYVFNNKVFIKDTDIHSIFRRIGADNVSHAFYLGRELQKALLAVKLGKRYVQEEDLRWGYLS